MIGEPAPGFRLSDADGCSVELGDFLDRPVLLIFSRHLN